MCDHFLHTQFEFAFESQCSLRKSTAQTRQESRQRQKGVQFEQSRKQILLLDDRENCNCLDCCSLFLLVTSFFLRLIVDSYHKSMARHRAGNPQPSKDFISSQCSVCSGFSEPEPSKRRCTRGMNDDLGYKPYRCQRKQGRPNENHNRTTCHDAGDDD